MQDISLQNLKSARSDESGIVRSSTFWLDRQSLANMHAGNAREPELEHVSERHQLVVVRVVICGPALGLSWLNPNSLACTAVGCGQAV